MGKRKIPAKKGVKIRTPKEQALIDKRVKAMQDARRSKQAEREAATGRATVQQNGAPVVNEVGDEYPPGTELKVWPAENLKSQNSRTMEGDPLNYGGASKSVKADPNDKPSDPLGSTPTTNRAAPSAATPSVVAGNAEERVRLARAYGYQGPLNRDGYMPGEPVDAHPWLKAPAAAAVKPAVPEGVSEWEISSLADLSDLPVQAIDTFLGHLRIVLHRAARANPPAIIKSIRFTGQGKIYVEYAEEEEEPVIVEEVNDDLQYEQADDEEPALDVFG